MISLARMIAALPTKCPKPMQFKDRERHADFWLDGPIKRRLDEDEEFSADEYIKAKESVAQFVRIMVSESIEVKFRDPESDDDTAHTDGETVTIPGEIGTNFDATVGTALHEASHIVRSDFGILEGLNDGDAVPQDIVDKLRPKLKKSEIYEAYEQMFGKDDEGINAREQASRALHSLWNAVEDRWIDNWAYNRRPGYWGYYVAVYNTHWHSDEVSEIFQYDDRREEVTERLESGEPLNQVLKAELDESPESFHRFCVDALQRLDGGASESEVRQEAIDVFSITPDWDSYAFRIINITNSEWNPDALPGLREIWDTFDVHNIGRLDSSEESFEVACDILRIVLEHIEDIYVHPKYGGSSSQGSDAENQEEEETPEQGDMPDGVEDIVEDQLDHMQGEPGEEIDAEKLEDVRFFESPEVEEREVGENGSENDSESRIGPSPSFDDIFDVSVSAMFVGSVSESFLQENFEHLGPVSREKNDSTRVAVKEGIKMGKVLGNKLRVFDDKRNTKYTRRRKGKIDDNLLAEIGFSSRLFYTEEVEEYKSGFLHISVDASGSMDRGDKFERAMKTAVALAQAASMIDNLRCQVSFRSTCNFSGKKPLLILAYDSTRDSMRYVKNVFPYFEGSGTTPEGLAFETMREEILKASRDRRSYFVNLSDGMPYFTRSGSIKYSGGSAHNHTKKEVELLRNAGISVLSYYIGSESKDNEDDFREMYGDDSEFINVENITDIRKTMNNELLDQNRHETKRVGRR